MGKLTISMAIFNSYVKLPEGIMNVSCKMNNQNAFNPVTTKICIPIVVRPPHLLNQYCIIMVFVALPQFQADSSTSSQDITRLMMENLGRRGDAETATLLPKDPHGFCQFPAISQEGTSSIQMI